MEPLVVRQVVQELGWIVTYFGAIRGVEGWQSYVANGDDCACGNLEHAGWSCICEHFHRGSPCSDKQCLCQKAL